MGSITSSCQAPAVTKHAEPHEGALLEVSPAFRSPLAVNSGDGLGHAEVVRHETTGKPVLRAGCQHEPDALSAMAAAGLASIPWETADGVLNALNTAMERMWPYLTKTWERDIRHNLTWNLHHQLPEFARGKVEVDRLSFPKEAGKFTSLDTTAIKDGLRLTAGVIINGGADFSLSVGPLKVGITNIEVTGELVVELAPLLGEKPVFAAMRLFFVDPPELSFNFSGALKVAEFPPIRRCIRHAIDGAIEGSLVQPNNFTQVFVGAKEVAAPEPLDIPAGVLRVRLVRAAKLQGADWALFNKRTSDSYVEVKVGSTKWTSSTVKNTCDPEWGPESAHDFVVYSTRQVVKAKVWDDDWANDDDFLGHCEPRQVDEVVSASGAPQPLYRKVHFIRKGKTVLEGQPKHGDVTFEYTWLKLSPDPVMACKDALAASCDGYLIAAEIDKLILPAGTTDFVQVHVRTEHHSRCTMRVPTPQGNIAAAVEAVDDAIRDIIENGVKEGIPVKTLAKISNVEETLVHHISKSAGQQRKGDMGHTFRRRVMVEAPYSGKLFLAVSKKELQEGYVTLEAKGSDHEVLAKGRFKFSELGTSWPNIEHRGEHTTATIALDSVADEGGNSQPSRYELHAMFSIVCLKA